MAYTATFKYNNLDATSDLNLHTRVLVNKGVVSGFTVSPVAGTANVTVAPGYIVSADGMIVRSSAVETATCTAGIKNNIVFRAVYNAPADPTLQLQVLSESNYNSDPQKENLVRIAVVDLTSATQASSSNIDYSFTDYVNTQGRSSFLGVYDNSAALSSAYPSAAPVKQRKGDYALVLSDAQSKPAFYIWVAGSWITFGNYEELLLAYNLHASGVTGNGLASHLTPAEKAALVGTSGTPSASNRFVTESDTIRLTTVDQKAALDNAISGTNPISAANPLVGDGIPVAVPMTVGVTLSSASNIVAITYGDTGGGAPFFGAQVYTGKLGLDANHDNRSTARNWFKIMDSFMSGYVDSDGPLYITDVLDNTGASSFNPSADASVSQSGYWAPASSGTSLRVKFNRTLAAGRTIYITFYAAGTLSKLAPQNAYRPPATAIPSSADAYKEVDTLVARTIQTTSMIDVASVYVSPGSAAAPALRFRDSGGLLTNTGLYYVGDMIDAGHALYSGVGVSCYNDTVAVFTKAVAGDNANVAALQSPLTFEQVATGSLISYRIYPYAHSTSPQVATLVLGTGAAATGFKAALTAGQVDSGFYGTEFNSDVRLASGKQVRLDTGSAAAPSVVFSGDLATGLYSIGSYGSGNLSFYRGVGLSMNGKTTFVFAADTAAVDGIGAGIDAPLLFEQFRSGSTVGYRIGIVQATTGGTAADRISFGTASSTADWTEWGYVHSNGFMTSRSIYGAAGVFFGPNANTGSATATASTVSLNFNGTPFLTYNNSNSTLSTSALIQSDTGFSFGPSGIGRIAASSTTYTLTYNGTAFMTYTGSTTRVSFGNAAVLTTGQLTAGVLALQNGMLLMQSYNDVFSIQMGGANTFLTYSLASNTLALGSAALTTNSSVSAGTGYNIGAGNVGQLTADSNGLVFKHNGTTVLTYTSSGNSWSTSGWLNADAGIGVGPSQAGKITASSGSISITLGGNTALAYTSSNTTLATGSQVSVVSTSGKLLVGNGTEAAPSYSFGNDTGSGMFYAGSFTTQTSGVAVRKAIAFSIEGSAVLVVGRNEANPGTLTALQAPLLIEQKVDSSSNVDVRVAAMDRTGVTSSLVLGIAAYSSDFTEVARLDVNSFTIVKSAAFNSAVVMDQSLRVEGSTTLRATLSVLDWISFGSQSARLTSTSSTTGLTVPSTATNVISMSATRALTSDAVSFSMPGRMFVLNGTEAAPSYSFNNDSGTGLFYAGSFSTVNGTNSGLDVRKAVGVSIEGSTVLLIGRNELNPGTLQSIQAPLLIEQAVNTSNTSVDLRIVAVDRNGSGSELVLGTSDYTTDFKEKLRIDPNQVSIEGSLRVDGSIVITGGVSTGSISSSSTGIFNSYVRATGTSANSVAFAIGGSSTGLYGTSNMLGMSVNSNQVLATSTTGGLHLVSPTKLEAQAGLSVVGASVLADTTVDDLVVNATLTVSNTATFNGSAVFNGSVSFSALSVNTLNAAASVTANSVSAMSLSTKSATTQNLAASNILLNNQITVSGAGTSLDNTGSYNILVSSGNAVMPTIDVGFLALEWANKLIFVTLRPGTSIDCDGSGTKFYFSTSTGSSVVDSVMYCNSVGYSRITNSHATRSQVYIFMCPGAPQAWSVLSCVKL